MPKSLGSADIALSFSIVIVASVPPESLILTVVPSSSQVPVSVTRSSWFLHGLVSQVPSSFRMTSSICSEPPVVP